MAARVPVISTNAGGLPEVNIYGETGFTANVGDVETMTQQAIELLSNEALLEKMREGAYNNAVKYDINNIVPLYENLYSRFCSMDCGEGKKIESTELNQS